MDWQAELERQSFREDDDLDIVATLLALSAADNPNRDLSPVCDHLNGLHLGLSSDPSARQLSDRVSVELGYRGDVDTYDDMRNADIADVVARRRGLPVALGLLYILTARAAGWEMTGMNFPGHFLIRLSEGKDHSIIDPFDGGRVLQMTDVKALLSRMSGGEVRIHPMYMAAVHVRQVIVRLQNNIKVRAQQAGDTDRAITILQRMSMFAPGESSIWLEMSGIEAGRGNMRRAIGLLEVGADHAPNEKSLQAMAEARQALGRRLN